MELLDVCMEYVLYGMYGKMMCYCAMWRCSTVHYIQYATSISVCLTSLHLYTTSTLQPVQPDFSWNT